MKINGLAAVVTGGGSGLGEATARMLAAQGAGVTVLDINGEAAEKVGHDIGGLGLGCDVSGAASAEEAMAAANKAHGPCRILVNCAGIAPAGRIVGRNGPMALSDFERVVQVNLIGSFNLLRLAAAEMSIAEPMEDGERGIIISTASIAANEGQLGQAAYAASKAGVIGMMLPAARELSRFGIRVMTIAPGLILTPLLAGMPQEVQDNLSQQPLFPKRFGKSEEFAATVRHIVENPIINADCIRLDGGMRMS